MKRLKHDLTPGDWQSKRNAYIHAPDGMTVATFYRNPDRAFAIACRNHGIALLEGAKNLDGRSGIHQRKKIHDLKARADALVAAMGATWEEDAQ